MFVGVETLQLGDMKMNEERSYELETFEPNQDIVRWVIVETRNGKKMLTYHCCVEGTFEEMYTTKSSALAWKKILENARGNESTFDVEKVVIR